MSIKLDTYNTSDNKVTKSQFNYEVIEDINIGLLHQVVKSNRTNYRNNTASVKTRSQVSGTCLLYTSPSPRDLSTSRMPSSA